MLFLLLPPSFFFFFFHATPTTEIYTLSLHDALPISRGHRVRVRDIRPLPAAGGRLRVEPGLDARAREGRLHARGPPSPERHEGRPDDRSRGLRAGTRRCLSCPT